MMKGKLNKDERLKTKFCRHSLIILTLDLTCNILCLTFIRLFPFKTQLGNVPIRHLMNFRIFHQSIQNAKFIQHEALNSVQIFDRKSNIDYISL